MSHTRYRVGSRKESFPPNTWTESTARWGCSGLVKMRLTLWL